MQMYELGVTHVKACCMTSESETIWGYMVKKLSAHGGCLGSRRRRKTWQPAKSFGESATDIDPEVSEWGNPPYVSKVS